jgi:uncharacterized protein YoxC
MDHLAPVRLRHSQGGNLSKEALQSAVDDVESSTQTFTEDLKGLERPDTETGQQAKDVLDGLEGDLNQGAEEIKSTVDDVSGASDIPTAVSAVSATLNELSQQLSSAFVDLDQLDTGNELQQATQDADSCAEIQNSGG